MPRVLNRTQCLLLCTLLVIGPAARAFAISWGDVGRVAAAIVTTGWSEVVLNLINAVRRAKDDISKELDRVTGNAKYAVTTEANHHRKIVAAAEQRLNVAISRGRQAVGFFSADHVPVGERQANLSRPKIPESKSSPLRQPYPGGVTGVEGKAKPPAPKYASPGPAGEVPEMARAGQGTTAAPPGDDVALLRQAENKMQDVARDFSRLARDIRHELDSVTVHTEANIDSVKLEFVKKWLGPLDRLLGDLALATVAPVGGAILFSQRLEWVLNSAGENLVNIPKDISAPAIEKIRAAHAERTTPIAEWAERFATLIEAAAGMQKASNMSVEQAKVLLRKELGMPTVPSIDIRQAATSPIGKSSTKMATETDVVRPGAPTGKIASAFSPHVAQAHTLVQRLEQLRPQIDERLVLSAHASLEREFQGKSPQQVQATRVKLLSEARQHFARNPRELQVVEQMINHYAQRQSTGFSTPPAGGRQDLTTPAGKVNPQTQMQRR